MRIVYLGTPDFSVAPLKAIVEQTSNQVVAVVCNNDKPFGRKKIITPPPVKVFALNNKIPVYQYEKIKNEGVEDLKKLVPDLMITCAFGQILSKEILDISKYGVFNIHASLLPKYRGASPVQEAILRGEEETGISIMKTDEGIDTGDVVLQEKIKIFSDETAGELFNRLSNLGAKTIVDFLKLFNNNKIRYEKQNNNLASHTKMIKKEDALIDWKDSSDNIYNKIRAYNPSPIAFAYLNNQSFKIYKCEKSDLEGKPGEVLCCNDKLIIGCGKKSISLLIVQKFGGKVMNIKDFLLGNKFQEGSIIF